MLNLTRDHLASDLSAGAAAASGRPARGAPLLWIPYVLIALVFVVFLGVNFWCYHKKHRERYLRKRDEKRVKEGLHERRRITVLMRAHFQSAFLRDSREEDEDDEPGESGFGLGNGGDIHFQRLDSWLFPQPGGWAADEDKTVPNWGSLGRSSLPTFTPDLPQPPATHAAHHHHRYHIQHHHPYRLPPPQTPPRPAKSQAGQNAFPPCLFSDLFPAMAGSAREEPGPGRPAWAVRPDLLAEKVLLQSPGAASLASPEEDLSLLDSSSSTSAASSAGTSTPGQGERDVGRRGKGGERGGQSPLTASSCSARQLPSVTLPAPKPLLLSPASSANGTCRTGGGCLTGPIMDHDQISDCESVSRTEES